MQRSGLYKFIGTCLAMDNDPAALQIVKTTIENGDIPWEDFVRVTSNHYIMPSVYTAFGRHGILPALPDDLEEHLRHIHELNFHRNQQILKEIHEITGIFKTENIEPVFLKGAGNLLQGLYYDPGDRVMVDIDILIPEEKTEPAASALRDNGYIQSPCQEEDFKNHHHLPGFLHPDSNAYVELHRKPLSDKYSHLLPVNALFSEKQQIPGMDAWTLSPRHQSIHFFIHNLLQDRQYMYRSISLRCLYDFYLLAGKYPGSFTPSIPEKYESKYNAWCCFTSVTFHNSPWPEYEPAIQAKCFYNQIVYFQDHPKIYSLWLIFNYNMLRFKKIIRLLITAPFNRQSMHYIQTKIGSKESRKVYFSKLRSEFKNRLSQLMKK